MAPLPSILPAELARGTEIEKANTGDDASAMAVALENLKKNPLHYTQAAKKRAPDPQTPLVPGGRYTAKTPLVATRMFRGADREATVPVGTVMTVVRATRDGRIDFKTREKIPLDGLRVSADRFLVDLNKFLVAIGEGEPEAREEIDSGMNEPPFGDTAGHVADRIWAIISNSPEDKKRFMDSYHSVDVKTHTGGIPGAIEMTKEYASGTGVVIPSGFSTNTWDGVFIDIVRKIERGTEQSDIARKVAEAEANGKREHEEYGDVFPDPEVDNDDGLLGQLLKNVVPKRYVCRGCGEERIFKTSHWGDVYDHCGNSGKHPDYGRGTQSWVCAGLAPDAIEPGMTNKGIETVPTVDPDAEFDKLIKMKESGEITPEQFNEKSKRLFGTKTLWMLRRGNDWLADAVTRVMRGYTRDMEMGAGLSHEEALEHAIGNWLTPANYKREVAGMAHYSDQEIDVVRQAINKSIGDAMAGTADTWMSRTAKDAARDHSCVMVNVKDPRFVKEFKKITDGIPDEDIYDPPEEEKYGREDRPHVTVKYGLHTDDVEDVRPLIEGFGQIKFKIKGVSFFRKDDREYDVLKLDVESDDLERLRKKVEGSLESTDEFPIYHPHMTLAYLKRGMAEKYVDALKEEFQGDMFEIDSVCFSDKGSGKVEIDCAKSKENHLASYASGEITHSEMIRKLAGYKDWSPSFLFDPTENPVPFPFAGQQSGLWGRVYSGQNNIEDKTGDDLDELWFLVENDYDLYRAAMRQFPQLKEQGLSEMLPVREHPEAIAFLKKNFDKLNQYVYETWGKQSPEPGHESDPFYASGGQWRNEAKSVIQMIRNIYGEDRGAEQLDAFLSRLKPGEREDFIEEAGMPAKGIGEWLQEAIEHAKGIERVKPSPKTEMTVQDVESIPTITTEEIQKRNDAALDRFSRGEITKEQLDAEMKKIDRMAIAKGRVVQG